MGRKPVMKASAQYGSDVPKIITNNTVGYKSLGWKEGTNTGDKRQRWGNRKIQMKNKNRAQWWVESQRAAEELSRDFQHCTVCYAGGLTVAVILGLLQLIADTEMASCCWWTRLSEKDAGWGWGLKVVHINMLLFMTLLSHCLHPVLTRTAHYCQWR